MDEQSKKIIGLVIFIWLLAFSYGVWGYFLLDSQHSESISNYIYHSLQLFALDGDWGNDVTLPWQHEIARFLAPFVTIVTLVLAVLTGLHIQIKNKLALRWYKNHIVVCGIGKKGLIIVQSLLAEGYRVIVIENDASSSNITLCRKQGACVVIDSATKQQVLKRVRLSKAKALFAVCDTTAKNIEIALIVQGLDECSDLVAYIHASDTNLSEYLERYGRLREISSAFDLRFFNVFESSARVLFNSFPIERYTVLFGVSRPHLVIFGFNEMEQHIVLEAIRRCHYIGQDYLKITIIGTELEQYKNIFFSQYPQVHQVCDFNFIDQPFGRCSGISTQDELIKLGETDIPTGYFICEKDPALGATEALYLHEVTQQVIKRNAPIFVYMPSHSGLLKLLESNSGEPEVPDNIFSFGQLEKVLSLDALMNDVLDEVGKTLHQGYLDIRKKSSDFGTKPADVKWEYLSNHFKSVNRQAGDHVSVKLNSLNSSFSLDKKRARVKYNSEEIEKLAEAEHRRWMSNYYINGWVYGTVRSEVAKVHPELLTWSALSDDSKEYDREQIRQTVDNYGKKNLIIGLTSNDGNAVKIEDINLIEKEIKDNYPNQNYLVMSSLGSHSEIQNVEFFMQKLGAKLLVPLPLPFQLYQGELLAKEIDFSFRKLIGKSDSYYEMPLCFGTLQTLSSDAEARIQQHEYTKTYIRECSTYFLK